ncbi:MAG: hypothetical protein ABIZ91_19735 [Gemmatimonadaceae bacterium]
MLRSLDMLARRARRMPVLRRLAIISRILLALAFIPTGMVKLLGHRFTVLPVDTPVGYFFEAMFQTGFYWRFLGAGQVIAGVLLLVPATTTLGAVAFFPVILNVTVVTWSVGFKGTTYITALMLLASTFLLCWDWERLRPIIIAPPGGPLSERAPMPAIERGGYIVGGVAGMMVLLATRSLVPAAWVKWMLVAGGVGVLMVLAGWIQLTMQRRGRAE